MVVNCTGRALLPLMYSCVNFKLFLCLAEIQICLCYRFLSEDELVFLFGTHDYVHIGYKHVPGMFSYW